MRNWSSPSPDRIANVWCKKAHLLREGVVKAVQPIIQAFLSEKQANHLSKHYIQMIHIMLVKAHGSALR